MRRFGNARPEARSRANEMTIYAGAINRDRVLDPFPSVGVAGGAVSEGEEFAQASVGIPVAA